EGGKGRDRVGSRPARGGGAGGARSRRRCPSFAAGGRGGSSQKTHLLRRDVECFCSRRKANGEARCAADSRIKASCSRMFLPKAAYPRGIRCDASGSLCATS